MNAKEKAALIGPDDKRPPPWKSSLYQEPAWVAIAWILIPLLVGGVAIYLAVR